eukprot:TRINITY_DN898_c0_g1_i2.p1 TRINITY_DN898_c0_g1~~TRINITY_DN898_c0_g1_i2.p1  ORF type:complete len:258 (-),score=48.10 TRINITY_DN898_c0_g1_i2:76-849(-)
MFKYILSFLQTDQIPHVPIESRPEFETEVDYFQLVPVINVIKHFSASGVLTYAQKRQLLEWIGPPSTKSKDKTNIEGGSESDEDCEDCGGYELSKSWTSGRMGKSTWQLIYKASVDGWSSSIFHELCNDRGPTIVIVKSTHSNIFGGYTSISWTSELGAHPDPHAKLFSLCVNGRHPRLFRAKEECVVWHQPNTGPTFGNGHDLYIAPEANMNFLSLSNLGRSFECGEFEYPSEQAEKLLAGSHKFRIKEIEIFGEG